MRRQLTVAMVGGMLCCVACGGAVGDSLSDGNEGGNAGAGADGGSSSKGGTSSGGVTSTYVEPTCGESPAPIVIAGCDPEGGSLACGEGEGCYPMIAAPEEPCGPAIYHFDCVSSGTGEQWADCTTNGMGDCAPGYLCIVTNTGAVCLQTCNPEEVGNCPVGLFCDGIAVVGVGGCA